MQFAELPKFSSQQAWTLDQLADGSYEHDGHILQGIRAASGSLDTLSDAERERLRYLDSLSTRGTMDLRGSSNDQLLDEISEVNERLADEPTYALLHTRLRVWDRPEKGRLGRVAILRGFVPDFGSPSPQYQLHQVLEGRNGRLGRRYDPVHVLKRTQSNR